MILGTAGCILGPLGAILGPLGALLELLGRVLGGSWMHFGGIWGMFWSYFGAWEASLKRFAEMLRNLEKRGTVLHNQGSAGHKLDGKSAWKTSWDQF